jgi:outer membrane immunogenic protein
LSRQERFHNLVGKGCKMNKIAYVLLGGAALAALAAPASAATVSGGRVEAIVGWDHGSISLDDFGIDDSVNADGILFGIGAGYDFAVSDTASLGIDLEASESTSDLEAGDVDDTRISVGRDPMSAAAPPRRLAGSEHVREGRPPTPG